MQATAGRCHRKGRAESYADRHVNAKAHCQTLFQKANADLMRPRRLKTDPDVRKSLHRRIANSRLLANCFCHRQLIDLSQLLASFRRTPFIQDGPWRTVLHTVGAASMNINGAAITNSKLDFPVLGADPV